MASILSVVLLAGGEAAAALRWHLGAEGEAAGVVTLLRQLLLLLLPLLPLRVEGEGAAAQGRLLRLRVGAAESL